MTEKNKRKYKAIPFTEFSAENMRDPEFVFHYVANLTSEGISEVEALQRAIRAYGVQAFADKIEMPQGNLSRFLRSPDIDPKFSTIEKIMNGLGIKNCHYKNESKKRSA